MVFRDRKNVNLSYNIQYPNIQRLLNDNFDELERRIIVMDSNQSLLPTVAYLSGEIGKRQLRVPFAVYSWSMWGYRPFWVIVPFEYSGDENKINAIKKTVENYKFAGTQYELKFQ
ncbi:MAG: hypothetical protein LBU51_10210 [Bacteroidales bacterium]|nr:hypothetical protein [Bacteroidales bacterium]